MTAGLTNDARKSEFSNLELVSCNLLVIHFRYSCQVTRSATGATY